MMALLWALFAASSLTEQIHGRLHQADILRGTFVQQKYLQGFSKPIRSEGHFVVARGRGILWDTQKPFANTLVVGRNRIVGARPDGSVSLHLDAADAPMVAINELLLALVAIDTAVLEKSFEISGDVGTTWHLELIPRDPHLAQVFKSVHVQGSAVVERLDLSEATGDRSTVTLSDIAFQPATLSAAEAARFD